MKKGIIVVVSTLSGMVVGATVGTIGLGKLIGSRISSELDASNKYSELFLLMNHWVKIKQKGKNLSSYFEKNGYKKVAIYGMNHAGMVLLDELRNTEVQVAYGIDKNADNVYADIDVFTVEEPLDKVDVVVVTAITYFNEIENQLKDKMDCPIISLKDVLYEV